MVIPEQLLRNIDRLPSNPTGGGLVLEIHHTQYPPMRGVVLSPRAGPILSFFYRNTGNTGVSSLLAAALPALQLARLAWKGLGIIHKD